MGDARIAVLESKVASMEKTDDEVIVKADQILDKLGKLDTKIAVSTIKIDNVKTDTVDLTHRIKVLEDRGIELKKWKKNTIALATVIISTVASLFFKNKT